MNKNDYIRHLLIDRQNKVSQEHSKALENKIIVYDQLNDNDYKTQKRIDFLKSYDIKNNQKIKDLQEEFDLITELLKEYI